MLCVTFGKTGVSLLLFSLTIFYTSVKFDEKNHVNPLLSVKLLQSFAHATIAQLSGQMLKFVVIMVLFV